MTAPAPVQPSPSAVFKAWLGVALRSFGGGPATLFLIRQAFVEEHGWITDDQFTRMWALCQLSPGINLFGLTILIGRRLHGWRGIALGLLGLALPSATAAVLITAVYARVEHAAWMRAALRGIVPATVGVGLAAAIGMLRPPLAASRREGGGALAVAVFVLAGACAAAFIYPTAVLPIILGAGAVGAIHRCLSRCAGEEVGA